MVCLTFFKLITLFLNYNAKIQRIIETCKLFNVFLLSFNTL
nr:MAG TPA: hypothetical protein [Caudoviricetes sp.]